MNVIYKFLQNMIVLYVRTVKKPHHHFFSTTFCVINELKRNEERGIAASYIYLYLVAKYICNNKN